jgi:hypothetical protein
MTAPNRDVPSKSNGRDFAEGARNLLRGCVGLKEGETVLIVREPAAERQYEEGLAAFVAEQAREMGAVLSLIEAPVSRGPETFPKTVLAAMEVVDHTIFFSRIGDQLRFRALPGLGSKTMTYTLDFDHLGDAFSRVPFAFLQEIQRRIVGVISGAKHYTIECPRGTRLTGTPSQVSNKTIAPEGGVIRQFTLDNFPVMIFPPLSTRGLRGRLVLTQALTSTSIHRYGDSVLPLRSPVTLDIDNGRILSFGGDPIIVQQVERHFDRVGEIVGGDPRAVNSWHTGINPATFFSRRALSDMDRWGSIAFGSPRYTHFHMCGDDPGDVCGQLFDATIAFDNEVLWDKGRLAFLDRPDIRSLMAEHCLAPDSLSEPRELGIDA